MEERQQDALVPDLEPRAITIDEYYAYAPEKVELLGGYLFLPAEYPEPRRKLLQLLLVNIGLLEAVRLVPEDRWREAFERVYSSPSM
ncbi:MAG: hypothetical protein WD773_04880 [Gemmatimonadales bacterium]